MDPENITNHLPINLQPMVPLKGQQESWDKATAAMPKTRKTLNKEKYK